MDREKGSARLKVFPKRRGVLPCESKGRVSRACVRGPWLAAYLMSTSEEHVAQSFFSMMAAHKTRHHASAMHKAVHAAHSPTWPLGAPVISIDDARRGPLESGVEFQLCSRGAPGEPTGVWEIEW